MIKAADLRRLELLAPPPRRARGARRTSLSAAINVTPLVDVVLVLLIIFMVVTPLLTRKIDLPKVVAPLPWASGTQDLRIAIDAAGNIQVQNESVSLEALPLRLNRELMRNAGRPIFLEADRALPFGSVRPILETLRDVGAPLVGLASAPLTTEQR